MNNYNFLTLILLLFSCSTGPVTAHDPRLDEVTPMDIDKKKANTQAPKLPDEALKKLCGKLDIPIDLRTLPIELFWYTAHVCPSLLWKWALELTYPRFLPLTLGGGAEVASTEILPLFEQEKFLVKDRDENIHLFSSQLEYITTLVIPGPGDHPMVTSNVLCFGKGGYLILSDTEDSVRIFDNDGTYVGVLTYNGEPICDDEWMVKVFPQIETITAINPDDETCHLFGLDGTYKATLAHEGNPVACSVVESAFPEHGLLGVLDVDLHGKLFTKNGELAAILTIEDEAVNLSYTAPHTLVHLPNGALVATIAEDNHCQLFDHTGAYKKTLTMQGHPIACSHVYPLEGTDRLLMQDKDGHGHIVEVGGPRYVTLMKKSQPLCGKRFIVLPGCSLIAVIDEKNECSLFSFGGKSKGMLCKDEKPVTCNTRLVEPLSYLPEQEVISIIDTQNIPNLFTSEGTFIKDLENFYGPAYCDNVTQVANTNFLQVHNGLNEGEEANVLCFEEARSFVKKLPFHLTFEQVILLSVLISLKRDWEKQYPEDEPEYSISSITSAILFPSLTCADFITKGTKTNTLKKCRAVYDWIVYKLEQFKHIELREDQTLYDLIISSLGIGEDPALKDDKGNRAKPFVASYLSCKRALY